MPKTVAATILLLAAGTMFAAAEERTVIEEHPAVVLPAPHDDRSITVEKRSERGGCESKTVHKEGVEGSKTVHKENCD